VQASAGVITGLPRIPRTAGSNKDGGAVHSYNAACCCSDCGLGHWFREDTAQCVRNYQYHHNYYYNHHPCAAAVCPGGRGKFHRFLKCVPPCRGERKYKLCKPYEGDPRCQKEQLCFDLSIHFCGCTDSKPLIISMSLFKCLCTNLTSNKSVTIKISFHFTQAMLQLLYQS